MSTHEARSMSLDYFHGHTIESVEDMEGGGFAIHLEGGGVIRSYDENLGNPGGGVVGWSINNTSLSATGTTIYLGPKDNPMATAIHLNPSEYSLQDDNFTGGEEVYPQRAGLAAPDAPVVNPAMGAVSDGPDADWLLEQEERAEEQRLAAAAGKASLDGEA